MTREDVIPCLKALDLGGVARILNSVFPHYSLCECARMAAAFALQQDCVCSLCAPDVFPGCVQQARRDQSC